jgi:hypothetical protein
MSVESSLKSTQVFSFLALPIGLVRVKFENQNLGFRTMNTYVIAKRLDLQRFGGFQS